MNTTDQIVAVLLDAYARGHGRAHVEARTRQIVAAETPVYGSKPEPPCDHCHEPFADGEEGVRTRQHPEQAQPRIVHEGCLRDTDAPFDRQLWRTMPRREFKHGG